MTEISSAASLKVEFQRILASGGESQMSQLQELLTKVKQHRQDFLWGMSHPATNDPNPNLLQFLSTEIQGMDDLEILIYNYLIKI